MSKKRVLIVDDAVELGRLLQAGLATLDPKLEVTLVPSGEEASLETSHHTIDLVVVDIRLPGVSGLDLTRRIRARHKATRIIQISGLGDADLKEKAMEAGADTFFAKPLNLDEFLREAGRLLGIEPQPPAASAAPDVEKMGGWLRDLRLASGAQAAAVIDAQGRILSKDGEWGEVVVASNLLPELARAALSAAKLSRSMGSAAPETALVLRGAGYDVIAACSEGDQVTLLGCLRGRSQVRLPIALEEALAAQKALREQPASETTSPSIAAPVAAAVLPPAAAGEEVAPKAEPVPEPQPQAEPLPSILSDPLVDDAEVDVSEAADLAALFDPKKTGLNLGSSDLDSFWDIANDGAAKRPVNPDTLTYDQARKMGLAPDE